MNLKFDVMFENVLGRYQQAGFIAGDRVKFKKNALKHEFFKEKAQGFVDIVKSCMADGFDKILRISVLKSPYQTTSQNYRGGTESPASIYADVVIEANPGLYTNPMTVPVEILELQDDNDGRGPVPDSLKRKSKDTDKPEDFETKQSDGKSDPNLSFHDKNVVIPNGNKWDDSKAGGGNQPKK